MPAWPHSSTGVSVQPKPKKLAPILSCIMHHDNSTDIF